MLKSMTGYGQAKYEDDQVRICVEVKALNAKHADVSLYIPNIWLDKEIAWKNALIGRLDRGRIALSIRYESKQAGSIAISLNKTLFKGYYQALTSLAAEVGASTGPIFQLALKVPGVISPVSEIQVEETITKQVETVMQTAISQCDHTRQEEGIVLAKNMAGYLQHISQSLASIEALDVERIQSIKLKLTDKLKPLKIQLSIDENRLEQELIHYIERIDITEEKVRLASHLAYFEQVMRDEVSAGKKLGFIAQEIGREINTIGAKANDAAIQKQVILMKEELEKIKEQLQNIL